MFMAWDLTPKRAKFAFYLVLVQSANVLIPHPVRSIVARKTCVFVSVPLSLLQGIELEFVQCG
jgi:hypothetical protein